MTRPDPARVETMAEVRAAVDSIDRALVALLAERMRFMAAAARIKAHREEVRDEARKAEVIAHVQREAAALGLSPAFASALWDMLVEHSIRFELAEWDRLRGSPAAAEVDDGASDGARTRDLRRDRPAL